MHRRSALTLVCALAIGLVAVAPPALAGPVVSPPEPRPVDDSCPPQHVPEDGFVDVPEDGAHEYAVDCVVHWKIANGLSRTSYGPEATVTRAQMASFIARLIDASDGHLPASDVDHFTDDDASTHEASIDRLAAVGIVGGRGAGVYEPDSMVTRAQMAAFLTRAYDHLARQHGAAALPAGQNAFLDDDGNALEPAIDTAAAAGFASGYGDGGYRPAGFVRRDQMASFLARVLDLAVEEGMAFVPRQEEAPTPSPSASRSASPSPSPSPSVSRSPSPRPSPSPTASPSPAGPGNSKNCGDFGSWREAQDWFESYQPSYGDVANLDPDGDLVACDQLHDAPGSTAQRASGRHEVDVVQVYWTQPDDRALSAIVDAVAAADVRLRALTDGNIEMALGKTTGWTRIPAPEQPCDLLAIMQSAWDATGFVPGERRHLIAYFPTDDACASVGFAHQPGSSVWLNGAADVDTVTHELLHNVGLPHANALYCLDSRGNHTREAAGSTCQVLESSDPYDFMGYYYKASDQDEQSGAFGLANLLDLGAVPQDDVPEVPVGDDVQVFTLNRSTFGEGLRGLRITQDTRRYLVEYRAERASDALPAGDGEGGVLVRRDAPGPTARLKGLALMDMQPNRYGDNKQIGDFALLPGQIWLAPDGGFGIETVSVTADTATVRVMVRPTG